MQKNDSKEILQRLIALLLTYLDELSNYKNVDGEQFQYGARTAYTECLELIQQWKYAKQNGLDFDIEKKYPL